MTSSFDLAAIRKRFPALQRTAVDGRPVIHADAPGGTQVVADVIDAMSTYLRTSNANTHGTFVTSQETDALVARVRGQVAAFLGTDAEGVVFGPNMTTLTWHFARTLDDRLGPGDEIVCTQLDHDANVSPWLALAERTGATIRWVFLDPDTGRLDLETLEVGPRTRLVAFPRASNALGTVVDPEPFVTAARTVGALTFCDAVHAAPHVPLDRHALGIDALACSPYKFFGPHAGLLCADPDLLADLRPDKVRPAPDTGPDRWQTGTASFEAIAGVGAALGYIDDLGMETIASHEATLTRRFLDGVSALDHAVVHGPAEAGGRTPTFAVTIRDHSPEQVAKILGEKGIFVWSGHYYAVEPMRVLGLLDWGGAVRIGFVHYHGNEDVDRVLQALADLG
ncbi:MAG: cysteine desulfurase-like protein [Nitriliruptorales bacterium]|nr:cysteine desulfurase-like protein [Nitriliruptorales bacterium]